MGIVQLKIKEVVLKMSNLFAISLLLVSLHYLIFSVSGESNCESGYKSCEHKDHGDICIPDEETCSRNKRSAITCPNGEQNINERCRKPLRSTRTCPMVRNCVKGFVRMLLLYLSGKAIQPYNNLAYSSDLDHVVVNARAREETRRAYLGAALELPRIGVGVTTHAQERKRNRVVPGLASFPLSTMVLYITSVLTSSGPISGVLQPLIGETNI